MIREKLNIKINDAVSFQMLFVKGGEFIMGNKNSEYTDEQTEHRVTLDDFYLGQYPVAQQLWQAIMGENPSHFKGRNRPVETVSWEDAQRFLKKLNELTRSRFRLPTEAEWEYSGKGGIYSQQYAFCGSDKLKQVGWYAENSNNETHDVGLLLGNELGLYDMSGNVEEWCADWFSEGFYKKCHALVVVNNPINTDEDRLRVVRGGGCFHRAGDSRPTIRGGYAPGYRFRYLGFRLCLSFPVSRLITAAFSAKKRRINLK